MCGFWPGFPPCLSGEFEYGCSGPCLFKSTDGGDSWVAITSLAGHPDILDIAIDPSNSSTLYVATYGYGAFKSTDGGSSWIALSVDPKPPRVVSLLAVDPVLPTTVYAVSNLGELFKSGDAGASWVTIRVPGDYIVVSVALDPLTTGGITIGTQFGVFRSADGGETWTPINSGLEGQVAYSLVVDPTTNLTKLYAGADGGVYDFEQAPLPCVPGATVLCLNGGRFEVTSSWTNGTDQGGFAHATPITDDAGYFTFFGTSNVELLVKVLDGCNHNGHLWFFAGGLTDRGVVLTVLDTQTGATRVYENASHTAFGTIQDTGAFVCGAEADARSESLAMRGEATAPLAVGGSPRWESGAVGSCIEDGASLCLGAARYRATAQWFSVDGRSGDGQAMRLTDDTGAFWFFAAANPEVVVKVLDGCGVNARQWVFAAGLTNVNVVLTVTDTQTGQAKIYVNPQRIPFEAIQDTDAFEGCP